MIIIEKPKRTPRVACCLFLFNFSSFFSFFRVCVLRAWCASLENAIIFAEGGGSGPSLAMWRGGRRRRRRRSGSTSTGSTWEDRIEVKVCLLTDPFGLDYPPNLHSSNVRLMADSLFLSFHVFSLHIHLPSPLSPSSQFRASWIWSSCTCWYWIFRTKFEWMVQEVVR